jgi:Fe-S cluster biogenesis protein NfuA
MGAAPEPAEGAVDLRAVGERIEALLVASAAHGAVARERSEELVRLVTDLYGAGFERLLEIMHNAGRLDAGVLGDIAADDLVASLLLVHGLHPYDLPTRVERALQSIRPGLQSQGARVDLVAVDEDGTVRLRLSGAVSGCTATTLTQVVESAVDTAAPDAAAVRVEVAADPPGPSIIPVSALRSRLTQAAR